MATPPQRVYSDRYEPERLIARGGMAEVWLARDALLDRRVALKVLFSELSVDPNFVERFRREAQAAANLSHPNIVSVYDWGEAGGTYYIVMEYVEGQALSTLVRSEGPLPPDRAAAIGADVAGALGFAHRNGVIHRDVKPGNILITPDDQVKVTDFGIARAANTEDHLTQTGAVMGTATYFSPEQAQGLAVDQRSDVYSVGVVLYEMVTGRPPFVADGPVAVAYKHVHEDPVPPGQVVRGVPAALDAIILQALSKHLAHRYASAEELRADLSRFRHGRSVLAVPPPLVRGGASAHGAGARDGADVRGSLPGGATGIAAAGAAGGLAAGLAAAAMGGGADGAGAWSAPMHGGAGAGARPDDTFVRLPVSGATAHDTAVRPSTGGGPGADETQVVAPAGDAPWRSATGPSGPGSATSGRANPGSGTPARAAAGPGTQGQPRPGAFSPGAPGTTPGATDPSSGSTVRTQAGGVTAGGVAPQGPGRAVLARPVPPPAVRSGPRSATWMYALLLGALLVALAVVLYLLGRQLDIGPFSGSSGAPKPPPTTTATTAAAAAAAVQVQVPADLVGKSYDDAVKELQAVGLGPKRTDIANGAAVGTVVAISPKAGDQVPRNGLVELAVSSGAVPSGAATVAVPTVTGLDQQTAARTLQQSGLTVGRTVARADPTTTAGQVISQAPAAGSQAHQGDAVTLTVSSGPGTVPVPDETGKDQTQAANLLRQAGFAFSYGPNEASKTVPAGSVIRTSPTAGNVAPTGSTVTIIVSSGPAKVRVPGVGRLREPDARAAIEAQGLVVTEATVAVSSSALDGRVIQQSPPPGTATVQGDMVNIITGTYSEASSSTSSPTEPSSTTAP